MKKLITLFALLCVGTACLAGVPQNRHSVRLGWGDMMFETMVFHPSAPGSYDPSVLPAGYKSKSTAHYGFTGHIFGEYMYSFTDVTSVGFQADFEGIFWREETKDRNLNVVSSKPIRNYNVTLLPTVRFTYFRSEWVNIYSGVSAGLLLASDNLGQFELAPALDLNFVGFRFGKGNFGGFVNIGMLSALSGANSIYMFGSRVLSVGVNYIW